MMLDTSRLPLRTLVLALALAASGMGVHAQTAPQPGAAAPRPTTSQPAPSAPAPSAEERKQAEIKAAWAAANEAATIGPAKVTLLDQGQLALPANYAYIPEPAASRVMRSYGNVVSQNLVGLVVGTGPNDDWIAVLRFIKEGYIKDDDAKDWNADDLLASIKEGTEQANASRVERGFPRMQIIGWVEKPAYDAATHRLVWSLSSKTENQAESDGLGVNYNTYALGRDGYFSLNLITNLKDIESQKPIARELLSDLSYVDGKRYQDFDSSTDKVAAYGLAALMGAAAAKKLGVFALIAAFALKFGKVGLLALAGLGAVFVKLFRGKKGHEA